MLGVKSDYHVGPRRGIQSASRFHGLIHVDSHGRDNKLFVWKLGEEDEAGLARTLPVDANDAPHKQPWLLHVLTVNTLNFCPFAMCRDGMPQILSTRKVIKDNETPDPVLIAVPNTIDSGGVCWTYI